MATSVAHPAGVNVHVGGILDITTVPADPHVVARATELAVQIAQELQYVGVLGVELFEVDGAMLVNELAPRPHNSGHWTLDAAATSQFEQQVRALCGLPLGSPELLRSAVMVNLLGELWESDGTPPDWACVLTVPEAKLRLYGKDAARPGRKMGHYCVLARDCESALRAAESIKQQLQRAAPARARPTMEGAGAETADRPAR